MTTYGYSNNKEAVLKRLRRVEGQVRGVAKMVEADTYCIDILTQISAIQAATDKIALELLREHTKHCLLDESIGPRSRDEKINEVITAIDRLIK
ncbi:MAG TPA: metal-sensitive transcriptional regulator [Candidatus Saccharimonadales bacterium]|nr:metal-sensitive transcriptional regulator [Candidatus Saccharimonadales bacterium]